jgi:hypothetical protein
MRRERNHEILRARRSKVRSISKNSGRVKASKNKNGNAQEKTKI